MVNLHQQLILIKILKKACKVTTHGENIGKLKINKKYLNQKAFIKEFTEIILQIKDIKLTFIRTIFNIASFNKY